MLAVQIATAIFLLIAVIAAAINLYLVVKHK